MSDMGTTLAVDKAIDRQLDDLIRAAARQAQKTQGAAADPKSKSQVRNLVNVAEHTQSLEAVTNFIRYQIGRKIKIWQDQSFGKGIIDDIEKPDGVVKAALAAVIAAVPSADKTASQAKIIALYVGYLNRCFVCAQNPQAGLSLSSALSLEGKG